jgi:hypothetical protein
MKKWLLFVVVGVGLLFSIQAMAQPLGGCCCAYVRLAMQNVPETTICGTVVGYALPGLVVKTEEGEEVTVYGIGPWWFWRSQGIERPKVGEDVTIIAYEVTLNDGQVCLIAKEIETNQGTMVLRDAETGLPLWSGPMRNR